METVYSQIVCAGELGSSQAEDMGRRHRSVQSASPNTSCTLSLGPFSFSLESRPFPCKGGPGRGKHDGMDLVPSSEEQKEWGMGIAGKEGGREIDRWVRTGSGDPSFMWLLLSGVTQHLAKVQSPLPHIVFCASLASSLPFSNLVPRQTSL